MIRAGVNLASRRHGFYDPHAAAYYTALSYYGFAAQNSRVGVNRNVVFYCGMALDAGAVFLDREGAQGNALVYFHIFSYHRGFTDHDAGSVIDKKVLAYFSAGVYVYAGAAVDYIAHHAGDKGYLVGPEKVGHAVYGNGLEAGI